METLIGKHWHHVPGEEVVDLLSTDTTRGLDELEVKERLAHFGANAIPPRRGPSALQRFLLQFHQPLVYILLAAGVIALLFKSDSLIDAGVIFGVVLINAVIGFVQESKAVHALEALSKTMTTQATVVRAGHSQSVPSDQLVPGDIVVIQSGDKVPADLRLLRSRELRVDESALTGESVPVEKDTEILPHDMPLAERRNMVYTSALVTYGQATGVVVATGGKTEVGRISQMIAEATSLDTPLTRDIARFSHVVLWAILALAALTFFVGLWHHGAFEWKIVGEMLIASVALAVAAIPEGLPAVVTITLALGVARMARRHAIIRKLPAVETLGSTTVICSDKTGTLTENQMMVREAWAGGAEFTFGGSGYNPQGEVSPTPNAALVECLRAGLLCNDARLEGVGQHWRIHGDPTEAALVVSARKADLVDSELRGDWPRIDTIPFESEHKYMATLHAPPQASRVIYLKGAVEVVANRCDTMLDAEGRVVPLDPAAMQGHFEQMAAHGLRVLAFARRDAPLEMAHAHHEDVAGGLTLLGLQGMIDPPRAEAIAAVATCQRAGVRVKMITGDHALTAAAIARQVGLEGRKDPETQALVVYTGRQLQEMSDAELIESAESTAVFARVSPEQKLRLVRALQARGQVVAMTGDGVNDAPALKQADIGVAMGITGTEVAKEAADMVLTDDNFASIEAAVEEGRGVFDNLTKFISFALPTNVGQGLVILVAIVFGLALPMLPSQILWINMVTAVLLGLMLAFEPNEPGIMLRPPRDPKQPILDRLLMMRVLLVSALLLIGTFALYEWALYRDVGENAARTVAVNVFAIGQTFYLFNCRSLTKSVFEIGLFSNRWVWAGVAAMVAAQLFLTYSPLMNRLFHTAPISPLDWVGILAVGVLVFVVVGAEKRFRRRGDDRVATG
ncbi:MAG: cation-transporting P-type ATPase [Planctomycetota bacterium]